MSLVGTLAKVAAGALIARGVGKMVTQQRGGASGGAGGTGAGGGLGDMLGGMLGGGAGGAGGAAGGLGGMLGGMLGGKSGGAPTGGLADMLSGRGGGTGGLGGLLESLGGAQPQNPVQPAQPGAAPAPANGSLGDLLNSAFDKYGEPEAEPTHDQEAQAKLLLRAMIMAAKCDGQLDDTERGRIIDHLGDATPEDIEFVQAELAAPVDVAGLAAEVPPGMAQQVYLMSLMAIDLDQRAEAQYLHDLASALNMQPPAVNAIHDQVGAPKIYS